jgi:hypothetical protein
VADKRFLKWNASRTQDTVLRMRISGLYTDLS